MANLIAILGAVDIVLGEWMRVWQLLVSGREAYFRFRL